MWTKSVELKNALKEAGYNSNMVSVKSRNYSTLIVTIRKPEVDRKQVEEISKSFESISRCDASGEILSGGNTFVFVQLSDEVKNAWAAEFMDDVNKAVEELKTLPKGYGANVNENFVLFASRPGVVNIFCKTNGVGTSMGWDYMDSDISGIALAIANEAKIKSIN